MGFIYFLSRDLTFLLFNKLLNVKRKLTKMGKFHTLMESLLVEAKRDQFNTLVALDENPLGKSCILNAKEVTKNYLNTSLMKSSWVSQHAKTH